MNSRTILAANLRRLRREKGLSQEALASLAAIDRTYVSSLERENYSATIDMLDALANALDTTAWALIKSTSTKHLEED